MTELQTETVSDTQDNIRKGWGIEQPVPFAYLIEWREPGEGTAEAVVRALGDIPDGSVEWVNCPEIPPEQREEGIAWMVKVSHPRFFADVLIIGAGDPKAEEGMGVLTIQFMGVLNPADAYTDHVFYIRLLARAFPTSPLLSDPALELAYSRHDLETFFLNEQFDPPLNVLWSVESKAVDNPEKDPKAAIWLYTRGLLRCGLPELEMLGVTAETADAAAHLLDCIAGLLMENPLPMPGERFEIGPELPVWFIPWLALEGDIPDDHPASLTTQVERENPTLQRVRAVICGVRGETSEHPPWFWPIEAAAAVRQHRSPLYLPGQVTKRQEQMARATWTYFINEFSAQQRDGDAGASPEGPTFLVQSGAPFLDGDGSVVSREHLWYRVVDIENEVAVTELVSPVRNAAGPGGDSIRIPVEQVTDWKFFHDGDWASPEIALAALSQKRGGKDEGNSE